MWREIRKAWFDLTTDERRVLAGIVALLLIGLAARALWYGTS